MAVADLSKTAGQAAGQAASRREAGAAAEPAEFAWRVLGLLNLFRLALGAVLIVAFALATAPRMIGVDDPTLAWRALLAMLLVGCVEMLLVYRRWPNVEAQTYLLFTADLAIVVTLVHAGGGVSGGLGGLIVVSVGALALLSPARRAFAFAAVAALVLLFEQTLAQLHGQASGEEYLGAGLLGAVVFLIVSVVQLVRRRIVETEALAEQRGVDLRNLVELNEYIIQHLRESIAVVDDSGQVRLMNESAMKHLGAAPRNRSGSLESLSPELARRLAKWRSGGVSSDVGNDAESEGSDRGTGGDGQTGSGARRASGDSGSGSHAASRGGGAVETRIADADADADAGAGASAAAADADARTAARNQGSTNDRGSRDKNPDAEPAAAFLAADGSTMIDPHFAPLGTDRSGGVVIFLEDTSLIADRVQQTKLAALGRLSASIAHEIRNPIGAMSHAGQLLAESPNLRPEEKRLTDIIRVNANRVSKIVESVLALSRRDQTRPERLQIRAWMQDFAHEFVQTLELYEGAVSVTGGEADFETSLEAEMDPTHLHQVVWNLCDNAVKYASETAGAIAVELSCGRVETSGRPYLEVADRGPGIDADQVEQIFEPFYTGHVGGTGLGLYICRELAERNGAALRYLPRPGGGSQFRIVFADPSRWQSEWQSDVGDANRRQSDIR